MTALRSISRDGPSRAYSVAAVYRQIVERSLRTSCLLCTGRTTSFAADAPDEQRGALGPLCVAGEAVQRYRKLRTPINGPTRPRRPSQSPGNYARGRSAEIALTDTVDPRSRGDVALSPSPGFPNWDTPADAAYRTRDASVDTRCGRTDRGAVDSLRAGTCATCNRAMMPRNRS